MGLSTFYDLVDHRVGTLFTHIIDHDIGAEFAIHEGVGAAETGTCTGNDNSLSVKSDFGR